MVDVQKAPEQLLSEGARPRVLVVDDSADNRELLVNLLEDDYDMDTAVDGLAGLAAIESHMPDVVLLDLMMPNLDGFGVLDALATWTRPVPPILVISAASERDKRIRALESGALDYVVKPVDGEELRVRVRNAVRARLAEVTLRRHAERVEAEVTARTTELRNANAELLVADRYKDEFLSVISHELRTPLNFIMGFASTLEDGLFGDLEPKQRDAVSKILTGADRMLALVNDLLDVARIQSGEMHLVLRPTGYGPIVEEALATLAPLAREKGLVLTADIVAPTPWRMDVNRMAQVLANLLANAVKFTESGEVRVRVRERADGQGLLTEVIDTGCGIDPDDQTRIFERFKQVDMSTTRKAGGTGLGLAIAKALVQAHGGDIGVTSEPGRGSTFWFTLPFEES